MGGPSASRKTQPILTGYKTDVFNSASTSVENEDCVLREGNVYGGTAYCAPMKLPRGESGAPGTAISQQIGRQIDSWCAGSAHLPSEFVLCCNAKAIRQGIWR